MTRAWPSAPDALYFGSLLPPLVAAAALVWTQPEALPLVISVGTLATLGLFCARRLAGRKWRNEWLLPAAVLNLVVVTPELALRVTPLERDMGIRNEYINQFQQLTRDDDLLWTLPPGPGVNTLGFHGPDITVAKPAGVCRILYLGDSVEAQGYPWLVDARLRAGGPTACVETVNLSLGGYSSYHGRALSNTLGARLDPDVVVVGYGWNDHWRTYGAPDSTLGRRRDRWWSPAVELVVGRSALIYTLRLALSGATERPGHLRVPIDEYVENLRHIERVFRGKGVPVLFLTAPSTHDFQVPVYLVEQGYAADAATVAARHRQYGDALRDTAAKNDWRLLDLESALATRSDRDALFLDDGIHFTGPGLDLLAEHVSAALAEILPAACGLTCERP